VIQLSNADQ